MMKARDTDTMSKPAERFSILIIPRRGPGVRHLRITGKMAAALVAGASAFLVMAVIALTALFSYRSAYLGAQGVNAEAVAFMQERASMLQRLGELEEALARTERFAAKVEATSEEGRERTGVGPLEEWEHLPDAPAATTASLGAGKWKSPFSKSLTKGVELKLDDLAVRTDAVEEKLHSLFSVQQGKLYFWASLPSTWPARGLVTSEFGAGRGWRGHRRSHEGIDIAAPVGTPISAPGDGVVTYVGYKNGYGKTAIIDHGYGISTLYGHCSLLFVTEGQRVSRGDLIANMGNTGRSSGPHLHYEVHVDGIAVNPRFYLSKNS